MFQKYLILNDKITLKSVYVLNKTKSTIYPIGIQTIKHNQTYSNKTIIFLNVSIFNVYIDWR